EKLFSQLKERKDDIDRILYSQNAYAVGSDFQIDYSTPCITCWVAKLELSVMKHLSELCDNIFDIVFKIVEALDTNNVSNVLSTSSKITRIRREMKKKHRQSYGNDGIGHDSDGDYDDDVGDVGKVNAKYNGVIKISFDSKFNANNESLESDDEIFESDDEIP
ncbi:6476_t:CDS:2, partial [Racocetra fulgida]